MSDRNNNGGECDALKWDVAAESLKGSHVDEVRRMVVEYRKPVVVLGGAQRLTISAVAAVAASEGRGAKVELLEVARAAAEASSEWVMNSIINGTDTYGITTGFGSCSRTRTQHAAALQEELIRYLRYFISAKLSFWFLNFISTVNFVLNLFVWSISSH